MNIIKRSGFLIPRKYEYKPFYSMIKEHLTRRTKNFQNSTFDIHTFYLESDD